MAGKGSKNRNLLQILKSLITPFIAFFNWLARLFKRQQPSASVPAPVQHPPKDPYLEARIKLEQEDAAREAEHQKQMQILAEKRAKAQAKLEEFKRSEERMAKWEQEQAQKRAREEVEEQQRIAEENIRKDLYKAISEGNLDLAKVCLDKIKETKPEEILKNPSVLLYKAIEAGHLEIIELLMQYGVRLDFVCQHQSFDFDKRGAMDLAICKNRLEVVNFLLKHGLVMTYAMVDHRSDAIFKLFLDTNTPSFNTDSQSSNEFNSFLSAIKVGHIETVKRSLDNLNLSQTKLYKYRDDNCPSVFDWAIYYGQTEITKLLLSHYQIHKDSIPAENAKGYEEQRIFYRAVKLNNIEIARFLINSPDVDLNYEYVCGNDYKDLGALYWAMYQKNREMAEFLIERGATFAKDSPYTKGQVKVIDEGKKHITFLYNKELECLDSVFPEKGIKDIIRGYVDVVSYVETPPPSLKLRRAGPTEG